MAEKKKKGLGKGIDSMIAPSQRNETPAEEKVTVVGGEIMIDINLIDPNQGQPRRNFDNERLEELAESIRQHGIVEPMILQKNGERYEIIAGERRFRAAKMLKLTEVPAIIKEYEEKEKFEIALIENIQREDLNAIEEASAYQRLIEEFGLRQEELALRVSKSRVTITNSMRLLKLDKRVQEMVIENDISGGHARALLSIEDANLQYETALKVCEDRLSVRETEKLVRNLTAPKQPEKEKKVLDNEAIYKDYEHNMISLTGAKVEIQRKENNKGKIVIEFNNAEEFEKIYEIMVKGGKQ